MKIYASAEMTLTNTYDGVGITGTIRHYMASPYSSGVTRDSSGWKLTPQETNEISRFHWMYETTFYSDQPDKGVHTEPAIIGVHGKDGKPGDKGEDAIAIILSSEAHAFSGTETNAIASSVMIDVMAYKGKNRVVSSINNSSISGAIPNQLTTSVSGNGTVANRVTVNASNALTQNGGILTIPIVVDGQTFNKSFSWSVAFKGKEGDKGKDGENANARNYLLGSKPPQPISSTDYLFTRFDLAEKPIVGETYTFAMKGSLSTGKTWFWIYNSGGSVHLGNLIKNGEYYYLTFNWKNQQGGVSASDTYINLYAAPNTGTGTSTLEWATMVKGSVPMLEWVPAHEDIQGDVQGVRERMSEAETALSQMTGTIEDISGNISELSAANYMTSSEYHESLKQELASFEANINLGPIRTTTDVIDQNFTFSDLGMIVGSDSQKSKVRVANDRIEMINENKVASYIVGGTMFADNFVALQGITLLNHTVTSENNKTVFRYQESE